MLALAGLGAWACADSSTGPTGPTGPFAVALRVDKLYPAQTFVLPSGPVIQCGIDIGAVATGQGIARWEGATFYWFAGTERSEAIDSLRVSGGEVRASWGRDSISAAREEKAGWDFSGRAPFDVETHFRFAVRGEVGVRTAVLRFTCGPAIPAGGTAVPILSVSSVTGPAEVEAGDTVRVTYTATSSFGIWVSGISVSEAFFFQHGFAEELVTSTTRTVEIQVPTGGALGSFLDLEVFALDGALQLSSTVVGGDMRLVDRTPPEIVATQPLQPQYAVGDRFDLVVSGVDNNQLRWLVYEIGAPANVRDSVPPLAYVPATTWTAPITVLPEWVGSTTLTVWVRDAAGLESEPLQLPSGGITFVPAAGLRVP